MKRNILVYLLMVISFGFTLTISAEDLMGQYIKKMKNINLKTKRRKDISSQLESHDSIIDYLQKIKNMKQGTFEATSDFRHRRYIEIEKLTKKMQYYSDSADARFSFGSVTMKNYNADTEKMLLQVSYNSDVYTLFPELKESKQAYLSIPRSQAKKLFGKVKTHNFHVKINYEKSKLVIEKMSLFGSYYFNLISRKNLTKKQEKFRKEVDSPHSSGHCTYYYTNASSVNIREKPTISSRRVGKLNRNVKVCVLKKRNSWFFLKDQGWILRKFLQKTKKKQHITKHKKSLWHCIARGGRATGWVERIGKENAERGAIKQCTIRLQSNTKCKVTNCYKL